MQLPTERLDNLISAVVRAIRQGIREPLLVFFRKLRHIVASFLELGCGCRVLCVVLNVLHCFCCIHTNHLLLVYQGISFLYSVSRAVVVLVNTVFCYTLRK